MGENLCQVKVAWEIGKGQIPNGPEFAKTAGKINMDSFRYDRVSVARNDSEGTKHHIGRVMDDATMVLIRALEADNNDHNMYPQLWYKFGDGELNKTAFGEGPLMLIGSVAKLVSGLHDITLWYEKKEEELPECGNADGNKGGAGKAATMLQPWPNRAILEIIIGIASPGKKPSTSSPKY